MDPCAGEGSAVALLAEELGIGPGPRLLAGRATDGRRHQAALLAAQANVTPFLPLTLQVRDADSNMPPLPQIRVRTSFWNECWAGCPH